MADDKAGGATTFATVQVSDSDRYEELAQLIAEVEAAAELTIHVDGDKVKIKPVKSPEEEADCVSDEAEADFDLPESTPMIGGGGLGGGTDDDW